MPTAVHRPPDRPQQHASAAAAVLAVAVGVVLADSGIVTLALPDILRDLGADVGQVAWVLTGFNLVLALAAVPAARVGVRRGAGGPCAAGLTLFAVASATCAAAGSLELLIAARAVQALGGALVVAASLELLVAAVGDRRAVAWWVAAGVAGAAVGPVAGGLLTEAIGWRSIFVVQVPLALVAVPFALRLRPPVRPQAGPADRPDVAANLALACVSAALTAALFLLVLLLVEGWRRTPALAAVTVTVIPVAALAAGRLASAARVGARAETMAGAILVAGGLAGLGLLPAAEPLWTVPAQVLVGLGLGLALDSLARTALGDRRPRARHGAWTIAARHAGIVVGLVVLTPIFTADLRDAEAPAREAIAAQVLDADLSATAKLRLADALGSRLTAESGRVPDLGIAFREADLPAAETAAAARLRARLDDQLERAATRAFRTAFLVAAILALLALVPAAFLRRPAGRA